jgi:hypothetical protein
MFGGGHLFYRFLSGELAVDLGCVTENDDNPASVSVVCASCARDYFFVDL